MREAQALAQLSHPNVVAVYDVGRVEDGVFLAMELVAGDTGDEWIKKRPPWREVLQRFRDAGRGLAAAHKVGLVHRDFKPANLILGSDGRVRVLDFGLARTAQSGMHETPDLESLGDDASTWSGDASDAVETRDARLPQKGTATPLEPLSPTPQDSVKDPMTSSERRLLDTPLTQVGAIVGTPPYMAPEQHLGGGCDARTDQFSFCVAFYQALYGERPFDGANYAELSTNIIKGKVKPAPAGSSVPAWLRAVVLRGLSVSPERRFASMDEILEAMARDPALRRRRIASAAAVTLLVAVAGVASWRSLHGPSPCRGAEREVDGVWNDARKQAVRAAFAKTGKPFAADAFAAVAAALDSYGARWVAMQTEACEATRVRGTQSSELLDLRMQCLQRRLDDVRAQVDRIQRRRRRGGDARARDVALAAAARRMRRHRSAARAGAAAGRSAVEEARRRDAQGAVDGPRAVAGRTLRRGAKADRAASSTRRAPSAIARSRAKRCCRRRASPIRRATTRAPRSAYTDAAVAAEAGPRR